MRSPDEPYGGGDQKGPLGTKEVKVFGKEDTLFLRRRAAEERGMAERAADPGAKLSHKQLAVLYAKEAERQNADPSSA